MAASFAFSLSRMWAYMKPSKRLLQSRKAARVEAATARAAFGARSSPSMTIAMRTMTTEYFCFIPKPTATASAARAASQTRRLLAFRIWIQSQRASGG